MEAALAGRQRQAPSAPPRSGLVQPVILLLAGRDNDPPPAITPPRLPAPMGGNASRESTPRSRRRLDQHPPAAAPFPSGTGRPEASWVRPSRQGRQPLARRPAVSRASHPTQGQSGAKGSPLAPP